MYLPNKANPIQSSPLRAGVSLPEVLTVVVIIGILSSLAVPRFMRFTATSRLESAAQILAKDMEWTKLAATRSGMKHYMRMVPGSDSSRYEIWMENSDPVDNRFESGEDSLLKSVTIEASLRFGGQDAGVIVAPNAPSMVAPTNGLGIGYPTESCRDDGTVPGQGSWDAVIAFCGGSTADMEAGSLYLTPKNYPDIIEAVVFDDQTSFRLLRYTWRGRWDGR